MTDELSPTTVRLAQKDRQFLDHHGIELSEFVREALHDERLRTAAGVCAACWTPVHAVSGKTSTGWVSSTGASPLGKAVDAPQSFSFDLCEACAEQGFEYVADHAPGDGTPAPFRLDRYEDIHKARVYMTVQAMTQSLDLRDDTPLLALLEQSGDPIIEYAIAKLAFEHVITQEAPFNVGATGDVQVSDRGQSSDTGQTTDAFARSLVKRLVEIERAVDVWTSFTTRTEQIAYVQALHDVVPEVPVADYPSTFLAGVSLSTDRARKTVNVIPHTTVDVYGAGDEALVVDERVSPTPLAAAQFIPLDMDFTEYNSFDAVSTESFKRVVTDAI